MDKSALRKTLKAARLELGDQSRARESAAIAERVLALPALADAKRVFCYLSSPLEVATDRIVDGLLARGVEVGVPLCIDRTTMLAVRFPGWEQIETGAFDIRQPVVREPVINERVDVALTPALGFSESGGRIGYGGGYYDRWLAAHRPGQVVGLAFSVQVLPDLPLQAHDVPMDTLVTAAASVTCQRN